MEDIREKILKEGSLKHRQNSYGLPRWKSRYVVFKVSGGGRLQFTIHKDHPTSPANEVKQIPIEEFGGLESSGKVDSERHVFSVVTTGATDSFSADCPEEMEEWTALLQEYLGKELTFGIVIPQKVGQLKSGRGILRIRNTGFTITTCDNPPRCLGTWQITHIRKFGGTGSFKFQTGSKCPTGELLYTIQTDDNAKVKSLFNDLSQHKPIFSDDRAGRRMTLERNHNHTAPYRQSPSRFSLQSTSGGGREEQDSPLLGPMYENKEAITEAVRLARREGAPANHHRRHSSNEDRTPSLGGHAQQRGSQGATPGNNHTLVATAMTKLDDQRMYQNLPGHASSPAPLTGSAPLSPTKPLRSIPGSRYPIPPSEPVPDGYYNVSPPLALKKFPTGHASSPSQLSPADEDTFFSEFAPVPPPPIKTVSSTSSSETYSDTYFRLNPHQRPTMRIEGENLVVQRTGNGGMMGVSGDPGEVGEGAAMYQNLDFMNKRGSDGTNTSNAVYVEEPDGGAVPTRVHSGTGGHLVPVIPALDSGSDQMVHNYTNVDFALEAAQGMMPGGGVRIGATPKQLARAGDVRRKVSAPPLSRDRSGAMSYRDPASPDATATPVTTATATVVTSNLSLSLHPKLKPSLSSQDLKEVGKQEMKKTDLLPEYYNLFVPRLPANLKEGGSMEDRNRTMHATLSSFQAPSVSLLGATGPRLSSGGSQSERDDDRVGAEPQKTPSPKKQERNEEEEDEEDDDDKVLVDPSLAAHASHAHSSHAHSERVAPPTGLAPHYDHLELVRTASGNQTTRFSHSPSPENLSRSSTPRPAHLYDQLPLKDMSPPSNEKREEPVGGANRGNVSVPYERKVGVLGHTHTYEYIEVMLKGGGSRVPGPQISNLPRRQNSDPAMSDSDTPVSDTPVNEHPSQWTTLADSAHSRSPGSHSRKKPLPLQGVPLDGSFTGKSLQEQLPPERVAPPPAAWARKNDQGEQEVGVAGGVASQRAESASPIPPRPPARHAHQHSVDSLDGGPPRGPLLRGTSTQSTEETPPVPPRSRDTSFTVSLPATEIQFDKPLVPPKPRVLEHKPSNSSLPSGVQYATMRFTNSSDDQNYAQVYPNQRLAPPTTSGGGARGGKEGGGDPSKVVYQSIDFEVTEGLRKTREDVEYQRSREIEWLLLQGELTVLKTLTAK